MIPPGGYPGRGVGSPVDLVFWLEKQGLPTRSLAHGSALEHPVEHARFLLASPSSLTAAQRAYLSGVAGAATSTTPTTPSESFTEQAKRFLVQEPLGFGGNGPMRIVDHLDGTVTVFEGERPVVTTTLSNLETIRRLHAEGAFETDEPPEEPDT